MIEFKPTLTSSAKTFSYCNERFNFIDVLAFRQYLIHGQIPEKYLKKIEEAVISIVLLLKNQIQ
jgi:hypothetical protein